METPSRTSRTPAGDLDRREEPPGACRRRERSSSRRHPEVQAAVALLGEDAAVPLDDAA